MASHTESLKPEVPMEYKIISQTRVSVTCLVVGSEVCGKTTLVSTLTKQYRDVLGELYFKSSSAFPLSRAMRYEYEGSVNQLTFVDMPGNTFNTITKAERLKCLENVKLICYCYAIDGCYSLKELPTWVKELNKYLPGVPSILVACKNDLREEYALSGQIISLIPSEDGLNFQKKFKIDKFFEFSDADSIDEVNKLLAGIFELASSKSMSKASNFRDNFLDKCCLL